MPRLAWFIPLVDGKVTCRDDAISGPGDGLRLGEMLVDTGGAERGDTLNDKGGVTDFGSLLGS